MDKLLICQSKGMEPFVAVGLQGAIEGAEELLGTEVVRHSVESNGDVWLFCWDEGNGTFSINCTAQSEIYGLNTPYQQYLAERMRS